jgi:hypothetical protein
MAPEVTEFIDQIIHNWDHLSPNLNYKELCDALYRLYHAETEQVEAEKTQQVFDECMQGLLKLHQDTGGTVHSDKHGFHEFHTKHSLVKAGTEQDLPYRIYINASTRNVIVLGRILVTEACLTGKALYFKIATTAIAVDERKDAIVVYIFGEHNAQALAQKLGEITGDLLTPTTPGLSKTIAPGISIAADPSSFKDTVSFGQSRVRPFATAYKTYQTKFAAKNRLNETSAEALYEVFSWLVCGAFRGHGINPLNPSTTRSYTKGVLSKAADTSASSIKVPPLELRMAARASSVRM